MKTIQTIQKIVGSDRLLLLDADKQYAAIDASNGISHSLPFAVVQVHSTRELIAVSRACIQDRVPLVIRAAGTGKSGGAVAAQNAIVIDITQLNRILFIDTKDLRAEVEPGVVLKDFQEAVSKQGLYYPPDPASYRYCTIGGTVAENAAGPSTLKYGTTREYVLGGEALLGTGELIQFGKRCPKGVTGFDIAGLLTGSEGCLAIFTKLILRLLPKAQSHAAGIFYFSSESSALDAVNEILMHGHIPKTLEYIDEICLDALQAHGAEQQLHDAHAALIIECDASFPNGAREQLAAITKTIQSPSLTSVDLAEHESKIAAIWKLRSQLSAACTNYLGKKLSEDIAVPLGSLLEFARAVKALSRPQQIQVALFGHAGDGNLHVQILFSDKIYESAAETLRHEIILLALKMGGTLSAEHGIGLKKKSYLHYEQSPALIAIQKRIKKSFDPDNLLNPGKIFDL